jgi:hypothetical protein
MCPEKGNASARPESLLSVLDSTVWLPNRTGLVVVAALLDAVLFAVVLVDDFLEDFFDDFLAVECFFAFTWVLCELWLAAGRTETERPHATAAVVHRHRTAHTNAIRRIRSSAYL